MQVLNKLYDKALYLYCRMEVEMFFAEEDRKLFLENSEYVKKNRGKHK